MRLLEERARGDARVEALVRADDAAEADAVVRPQVAGQVRAHGLDLSASSEATGNSPPPVTAAGLGLHRRQEEGVDRAVGLDGVRVSAVRVQKVS